MKKVIIFWLITFSSFCVNAQKKSVFNEILENTEKSKSGNYKDVLASLFQLATKNISSEEKTIELNTTLFAIKSKANPDLLKEENFIKATFARSLQLNFKLNLDDIFKNKGFTGGLTYAIINSRDRKLADFRKTEIPELNRKLSLYLNTIIIDLLHKAPNKDIDLIRKAVDTLVNNLDVVDDKNPYISKIKKEYSKEFETAVKKLDSLVLSNYKKIDAKTLWTVSVDGSASEKGKFNKASIGSVFLKGIKEKSEIDIRTNLNYADTLIVSPMPRIEFISKAGVNFKIAKGTNKVSIFEIKAALEYNSILKNLMVNEKKDKFLGNAEIRIRLADDLWLPLILKYDIEKDNFLGFLNLSYNFGSFTTNVKK